MGLELTELPSYLTDDSLTREEKLEKMDDLKALHDEMVEKVAFFEMRCEYMDKLLKKNEKKKKKTIKKKRFLKEENINELRHWVGNNEEVDWEAEFDQIDDDKDGKITFENFVR